jgi:hypothetical protein
MLIPFNVYLMWKSRKGSQCFGVLVPVIPTSFIAALIKSLDEARVLPDCVTIMRPERHSPSSKLVFNFRGE